MANQEGKLLCRVLLNLRQLYIMLDLKQKEIEIVSKISFQLVSLFSFSVVLTWTSITSRRTTRIGRI